MSLRGKNIFKYFVGVFLLILLANLSPIHTITSFFADNEHYKYSTGKGEFTFTESSKGWDTAMLYRCFNAYQQQSKDSVLYRLFSKNPFAFWRYADYINDPKYNLPYKNWKSIKKIRSYELKNSNNWQDF